MRSIGVAERALELLCKRALSRTAFGKPLAELGGNYDVIADSRIELDMCRLAVLKAAYMMDTIGNKEARKYISAIKVAVPNMALKVIDRRFKSTVRWVSLRTRHSLPCGPVSERFAWRTDPMKSIAE